MEDYQCRAICAAIIFNAFSREDANRTDQIEEAQRQADYIVDTYLDKSQPRGQK